MMPKDTLDRLTELAISSAEILHTDDKPFAIVPQGMCVHDLSAYFPPKHVKRDVSLIDAGSFSDYVNRFKTPNTLVFALVTDTGCKLKAILDYHGEKSNDPGRCDHVATYATCDTPEWKTWMGANRKSMAQVEFATWLEDNLPLFVEPKGADLLELVQTLVGKSDVRFTSTIRLVNGANKLNYDEDVELKGQVSTKSESVVLPQVLVAGIAPFQGSSKYEVRARFKHRIDGRKLSLWFETISPHVIVRDCVMDVVRQVAEKTGITPLLGNT